MKQLHLVDFDGTKGSADRESIQEYNVLRRTIGLPTFKLPEKFVAVSGRDDVRRKKESKIKKHVPADNANLVINLGEAKFPKKMKQK